MFGRSREGKLALNTRGARSPSPENLFQVNVDDNDDGDEDDLVIAIGNGHQKRERETDSRHTKNVSIM